MNGQVNAGVSRRKQNQLPDSLSEQARRLDDLQKALVQIAKDCGFAVSTYLQNPSPWQNAGRNPEEYDPYRPYVKEQDMIRDLVATAARIGTAEQRDKVRVAVRRYFEVRADDALEMIGTESEADLTKLTLVTEKEISEARCATITALTEGTPESMDSAAKENQEADTMIDQLTTSLRLTARRARNGKPKLPLRWMGV